MANNLDGAGKPYQEGGHFVRPASSFRDFVSPDPNSKFAAEKGRYALYLAPTCPWAHRTIIVRVLKGLEDIVDFYQLHAGMGKDGWYFSGEGDSLPADPLYGFTLLRDLYKKADPEFSGRITVPVLWDKKTHTIVNNESSEIIRMFGPAFDALIPEHLREASKPGGGLYPVQLQPQIDELNDWVYNLINNGVYKTGLAASQEAYDANLYSVFDGLDRVEGILAADGRKYLFGEHITEADVRLYTTIARFDVGYHPVFLCNLKMIRHDYPAIYQWYRRLFWDRDESETSETRGAFYKTTRPYLHLYVKGYSQARHKIVLNGNGPLIVPRGPKVQFPEEI
ncbi:glutathione S-transferase [Lasiosphaeris hirsuta]|uniref:Glutathione S-transferase n=1 Tax=Lasiosphaeris hirsuta TaxID=260670 RepID=A0AA40AYL1_9PEZI|nr:glutathione S-transferase [Lasiosphaeris hirsuta]